ncbi:hypothetical protein BSPWISOXPB_1280 [uncultured Gammaproteobacteria bacterium]|nr:hypothetical protein BSPWISOXPB_1280 [uncultured Gammaproteobacteria bacterium]
MAANTRKSHNKNHYQAMLDDTNNIYFYRIRSRDAAGRLTGHIVGNGLSTDKTFPLPAVISTPSNQTLTAWMKSVT